jgi:hypothetical protein
MAVGRLEPATGDIVFRKRTPESPIECLLYEGPEDWSSNDKTWILKLEKCDVHSLNPATSSTLSSSIMFCLILMVWDPEVGFKETPIGGQLSHLIDPSLGSGLGRGGTIPDENNIAMAFLQPAPPMGPTFLTVDFWKTLYLDDVYAKLIVLGVVDSLVSTGTAVRSVSTWMRDGELWKQEVPVLTTARPDIVYDYVVHSVE